MNHKSIKFLKLLSQSRAVSVSSTILEAELKTTYKTVAKIGQYLEEIGAVSKVNKRGGTADYTITPIGLQWLNQELRSQKRRWILILAAIIFIIVAFFLQAI